MQNKNIILIGMPGCGKTILGNGLAQKLGWPLIDTDDEIIRISQKTIPDLFEEGEPHFREWEYQAVAQLPLEGGHIISTGGGVVTQPLTMVELKKRGTIVHLDRSLNNIIHSLEDESGRPLLAGNKVEKIKNLYDERKSLYLLYRDIAVDNNGSEEKTIENLQKIATSNEKKSPNRILVMNGPNLNLLGFRQPEIYGSSTYLDLIHYLEALGKARNIELTFYQSNHEGELVDQIQNAKGYFDGILFNPAAYTHTSVALLDALLAIQLPTVEVHLSAIENREEFRQKSYTAPACIAQISGLGFGSYEKGLDTLIHFLKEKETLK